MAEALAVKGASPDEARKKEIMARLDQLGSSMTADDGLVFEGTKFVLPEGMEGNLNEAIKFLRTYQESQNEKTNFSRKFNYRPFDGAAAFQAAMRRVFGTTGIGATIHTFFGDIPPQMRTIPVSHTQVLQVPWGRIKFSMLDAEFTLGAEGDPVWGPCFKIDVMAPKKHQNRIQGFFDVVEDELLHRSIYRGKAIDAADTPNFLDVFSTSWESVSYTQQVLAHLNANVWTPIRHAAYLRQQGIPVRRAVLLEGPYGSGKTLAGVLTAQVAVQNGWTYILVKSGDDPYAALRTARAYAPAVVQIEDLDMLSGPGQDREQVTRLLDALDSASTKGAEVIAVFTTNFVHKIDKGVLRPGRIDRIIHIGALDRQGYTRLVQATIDAAQLSADINYEAVYQAFDGLLPAFAVAAIRSAWSYNLARGNGEVTPLTTDDLVYAAQALQEQVQLMEEAEETAHARPAFEKLLTGLVTGVLNRTEYEGERFVVGSEH